MPFDRTNRWLLESRYTTLEVQLQTALTYCLKSRSKLIDIVDLRNATPSRKFIAFALEEFLLAKIRQNPDDEDVHTKRIDFYKLLDSWPEPILLGYTNANMFQALDLIKPLALEFFDQWLYSIILHNNPFAVAWLKSAPRERCFTLILTDLPMLLAWCLRMFMQADRIEAFAPLSNFGDKDYKVQNAILNQHKFSDAQYLYDGSDYRVFDVNIFGSCKYFYLVNAPRFYSKEIAQHSPNAIESARIVCSDKMGTRVFSVRNRNLEEMEHEQDEELAKIVNKANELCGLI